MALDVMVQEQLVSRRSRRGFSNYHKGIAAEHLVAQYYAQMDTTLLAQRWRHAGGEIDLIVEQEGCIVFVEVKASTTLTSAADLISYAQIQRLYKVANAYLGQVYGHCDVECRFDLALVDQFARLEVIENAFL